MGARIERYVDVARVLPPVPGLGQSRQRRSRPAWAEHHHSGFECCLVTGGVVRWQVEGQAVTVGPDSCFLTRPGERHGTRWRVLEPCTLSWLQVDPSRLDRPGLLRRLRTAPRHAVGGAHLLVPLIEAMLRECRSLRPDSGILLRGLLDQFLVGFLRTLESPEQHVPVAPPALRRAEAFIAASGGACSVAAVARRCGLSRGRLHQLFRAHRHCAPLYAITEARMTRAQALLRERHRSITAIALALDFSSAQHFAHAFRRHCGCTPTAWRQQT